MAGSTTIPTGTSQGEPKEPIALKEPGTNWEEWGVRPPPSQSYRLSPRSHSRKKTEDPEEIKWGDVHRALRFETLSLAKKIILPLLLSLLLQLITIFWSGLWNFLQIIFKDVCKLQCGEKEHLLLPTNEVFSIKVIKTNKVLVHHFNWWHCLHNTKINFKMSGKSIEKNRKNYEGNKYKILDFKKLDLKGYYL